MKNINFESESLLALAPLAGFTDLPFRAVVKKFGVDLTFSEMISSEALSRNDSKTLKMLEKSPIESPYIVQIAGSNEEAIKKSVLILNKIEGIDGIDLNCGCPVPKITAQGSGSALLKNLPKLEKIVELIKKISNKQYTSVKIRLGYDEKIPELIAKSVQNSGADFISIHGRTKTGGYSAKVDYEAIKRAKESVRIPVFANGDIDSFQKAIEVKKITKTNALMIGRGSLGKPWIFYQIKNNDNECTDTLKKEVILTHFNAVMEFYGKKGLYIFRKHLHGYSKGYKEATAFRNEINHIEDETIMQKRIECFF